MCNIKRHGFLAWPYMWLWLWFIIILGTSSSGGNIVIKNNNTNDDLSTTIKSQLIENEFSFTAKSYNVTIPENSIGKTYVTSEEKIGIYLPLSLQNNIAEIKYRIINGDRDKFFKAEERIVGDFCFLLLRTRTGNVDVLNRERKDRYVLQVRGTIIWKNIRHNKLLNDNYEIETTVIVNILDTNDLNPLFYPTKYEEIVSEDTPLHKSILRVIAEDADLGRNGEIYYRFAEESQQFAVHAVSGIITLTRPLRYSENPIHELTVIAEDRGGLFRGFGGGKSRASTAPVTIRVKQVNLYAPEIYVNTLPDIVENSNTDIYAIVRVVDRDDGINGEIESLNIISGDPDGHFKIKKNEQKNGEYRIEIADLLDKETSPLGYNLTLHAIDKGTPKRFSYKIIPVHLTDVNDNAPVFSHEIYDVNVPETAPINTPVIKLKVTDADQGKNSLVSLEIVGGNKDNEFYVNPKTGMLYTAVKLDAEKKAIYTLTVSAVDQGNTGTRKQSSAKVKINIIDANDNDPKFTQSEMTIEIDENKPAGTDVIKVVATDFDSGENSYISYSIDNIEKIPFEIDPFSGLIKTKQILDYETMKRDYLLAIRASDWGLPYRRQTEMLLRIKVRDVNDNRPQFEKIDCMLRVPRYIPIGSEIMTVSAIDLDSDNIINYRIDSTNEDTCFSLDSITGVLSIVCDLSDIPLTDIYVNVTATDGTHFADLNVISVQLINAKKNINTVTDSDNGSNSIGGPFKCRDTGVVKKSTDASELAERNNQIINDERSTYDTLTPRRYRGNVHEPEFIDFPNEIKINESIKIGTNIIQIHAKDRDLDYNGKLVFGISSGDPDSVFSINQETGHLTTIGYLDREKEKEYFLNITVYDLGEPQKSTSKMLPITILDVNDNAPKFYKTLVSIRIPENILNGTIIYQANATDADLGENSHIIYSLVTETIDFKIDSITGVLSVNGKLDREKQNIYELKIRASDNGGKENNNAHNNNNEQVTLYSDALIRITIEDINDNPPKFTLQNYSVKIREDVPIWSVVAVVEATDPDENAGGEIEYILSDSMDNEGYFKIDSLSGTVRTIKSLDFEQRPVHTLVIIAKDHGEPSKTSEATLIIEVIDVNENLYPPVFDDSIISSSVFENQPIGSLITTVRATDKDPVGRDSKIGYSIRGGDGIGLFTIDDEGNVRTNAVLDAESKSGYWLTIYAQDQGVVPLHSQLQMYIELMDENDNTPLTEMPIYNPSVAENSPAGVSVLHIKAFDRDVSPQEFSFSITSGNPEGYFLINSTTGLITTSGRKLDRENQAEHVLEITLRDDGTPSLSSTTRVIVNVDDINDHGPEFEQKFYTVRIPATPDIDKQLFQKSWNQSMAYDQSSDNDALLENGSWETYSPDTMIGDRIFRVLANDKDVGENGKIEYSIKGGRGKGKFRIHPTTGMVYSMKGFDVGQEYEMMIRAADNGTPQRSHQTRVSVQVIEIPKDSKYSPVFKLNNQTAAVTESDEVGFLVALVQATDKDGDILWYDIIDGDKNDEFFIGRDNGNVLLAKKLDWEKKNFYNLTISVTDGVYLNTTQLLVNVLDINDHRPEFTDNIYKIEISESVEKGEIILQLDANDRDEDKKIFYSLHNAQNKRSLEIFHVDSISGKISLQDSLDRETIEEHILTVMVRDQGTPAKRNYARVIITVHDHNDHSPEFITDIVQGKIYETSSIGSEVVQIYAIDRDRGDNAKLSYSIISGNVGNVFTIDYNTGIISIIRELDLSITSEYILVVKASDHGIPPKTNTIPVDIFVTMADNAPPRFINRQLAAEIYENQPIGTYVKHVDVRSTSSLQYQLINGNKDDMFFVNPTTGVIITKKNLDYEKIKIFNLTLSATNMAGSSSTCNIIIHVLDINDNPPKFLQAIYHGEISEGAIIGSLVLTNSSTPLVIKAEDADSELNALLSYDIIEDLPRKYFHIDSSTGAIRTVMILDHETISSFKFHVKVSDLGKPKLSSETTAKVIIKITDINDCPPKFNKQYYNVTLLLPTYKNVKVIKVDATDLDSTKSNTPLRYDIIDGNDNQTFIINSQSGIITVRDNKNIINKYLLHVRVSDGKYSSVTHVNIKVEKSENSGLVFEKNIYEGTIIENSTKIMTVVVVNVLGSSLNENIIFNILNPTDMFDIGITSGAIRTVGKRFDRETNDHYELIVEAKSHSDNREKPRVAHVIVNVTIMDINDNCPIFVNLPYYAVVSVDAQKGSLVTKVHAIDMDSGDNGEVTYELKKGNGELFKVSRKNGEILLKRNLEGPNREYYLTIAARDGGIITPCSIEVPVNVKVIDRSMPIFDKQFYTDNVFENIAIDTPLSLSIQAKSDLDRKLIYSITKGNDFEEFALNFNTGTIYVVDELDYEEKKQYELTVRATDSISGVYAEVLVSILVQDVNDCPPEFTQDSYNVSVSEAASFGTSILKVSSRDNDTDINQKVMYTIKNDSVNSNDYFHIDTDEGIIYLKRSLDHETHESHHFTIIATDRGIPPLSSTSHVWVTVIDMNDNPPKFEQPSYTCSLSEDAERGQFVTIVTASDPDYIDEKLIYTIVGGNEQQTYSIDQTTGIITLINMQNFGEQKLTILNISVSDGVYTSFTRVKIDILPANKHNPKFINPLIEVSIMENQLPGKLITTVLAIDDDYGDYGHVTYTIPSMEMRELFNINNDNGEITNKKILDREIKKIYEILVMASDDGGRLGFTIVRVKINDENDNAPIFLLREYKISIHCNTTIQIPFIKVKAIDIDEDESSLIEYTIYEPQNSNIKNIFSIDSKTGGISLIKNAVSFENQLFEFFIRATDKGTTPHYADVPISIYIMSLKDTPPQFEHKDDKFFISESSIIGTPITTLKTISMLNNTKIKYRIISDSIDSPLFNIDEQGQITLAKMLDRELKDNHLIAVLAETDSTPSLTSLAEISLQVLDDNDHAPKFESNPYNIKIAENIQEATSIIKIIAHDNDLGSNGEVRYSFGSDIGELANVFTIDSYTGWITNLVQLDKEKQSEYKLQVVATDNGNVKHFSRTSVIIKLSDYNDNSPVFTNDNYYATVKEDSLPGTVVVKLTIIDKDIDIITPVEYYIISGDTRSQFQVRTTGEIYVAKTLDREIRDKYELSIVGTDGKYVFDTKVTIEIIDVNDNPPYCLKYRYREILSEGTHPGTYVLTVQATDYDNESNSKLRFYLTNDNNDNNNDDKFSLDKDTGVLKTIGQLDREKKSKYLLTAHVQDREKTYWECSSQLEIIITDLNDNPPVFTMTSYSTALPEDVKIGTLVGKVHATDNDIGINRKIKYEFIDSANGHFIISSDSGIITLAKSLDRETKDMYNLTIKAIDQGIPQLFSTTIMIVDVQDINDNPPEFTTRSYYASVPEINQIGSEVVQVVAISKDTGVNAMVYYSIVGGNEHKKFAINNNTGIITIAEQLDYERAREYFLTIQAIDGGIPPLRNYATANITVTDCNDNPPNFNQIAYRAIVNEDAKINDHVLQVFANDIDSNENGNITYTIERGDRLKQFIIDKKTGIISIANKLDRESISSYSLEVHARDNGKPILESFVIVNIEIIDANDNPPLFTTTNYTTVVQEDKPIGHSIIKFIVTDADISPNAEPYTFDFRSGNDGDAFRLDQDGTLRTAIKFNSRIKNQYILHIRVFDNGSQPLYSDACITIKIIEESQYPPAITPLEIIINSYMDEYPGGNIGKIYANDRDQYDTLQYNIVDLMSPQIISNNDLFIIDKNDGSLTAQPRIDVGEYRINVTVSDGKYYSHAIININVELINDKMLDNSIIIRFREVSPDDFIRSHRKVFLRTIRKSMNCRTKDIIIIGIQPSIDEINIIKTRNVRNIINNKKTSRQTIHNDLDLIFAVKKANGYYTAENIREALNQHIEELEESTKLVVEEIVRFKCNNNNNDNQDYCINGECRDKIVVDKSQMISVSTDVISFVTSKYKHKIECHCREGYAGNHCDVIVNECANNNCNSYQICIPDLSKKGYVCQCPEGLTGSTCNTDITKCHDDSCYTPRNPISFSGKSYGAWKIDKSKIKETIEDRLSFSLKIRTVQPTGNLMYASGKIDYNILEIVNGAAQYKFDLGSGEGLVRVNSVYISDGQWHEIQLERDNNNARLTVDGKHVAHGSAPGINDILNLQSDDLYLGAEVRQHPTILGFEDVQRGFIGCMDDVKIDKISVPLHMSGASTIAILKRFANVEFSCNTDIVLVPPGICGSQPCQNGGTCKDNNKDNTYECHCHARYTGIVCEIDTDPCASSPCLYGGRCKAISNNGDYKCDCIGQNLTGKRCEFGKYCGTNPCYNGGICEEGNNGPICKCHGFIGDRCETDINECKNEPCINGGTCVNEIGSYRCICTTSMSGVNCEHSLFSNPLLSQHLNITQQQLILIGIAFIIILIIIIFIIICITCRKFKKKRTRTRANNNINNETSKQAVLNSTRTNDHEFKRTSKLSNLEVIQREPPQCPPRPASYTPSSNNEPMSYGNSAAVALNNLDTLRSYGSAGDELENFPPDYLRNLNRTTPVPNTTLAHTNTVCGNTTSSDTDSLHKPNWQEQIHLASFINDTTKIKNDLKRASPVVPEMTSGSLLLNSSRRNTPHIGGTSVASVSSIEDDPRMVGGYHWDCSDWVRPNQNPLPNITEVPGSEVPDSSSFHSNESNESNTHQLPSMHGTIDPTRDISTLNEDQESEYIGESECGTDFSEQYHHCTETQRLNPLDSGGETEYKYKDKDSYLRHPNSYLPHYNIHTDTENEMNPLNGRLSTLDSDEEDEEEEEEEDDVVPYGFPSIRRNRCKGDDIDDISSVITTLEERNSLLGASNSDLSTNLCEIDDSEYEINEQKTNGRLWLSGNGVTQTSV
ncbi:fat-like cadherin-related tumor suppressor homolog isoform X2 [Aphidius gifuensis]|uniref:fat-like cadherin-related tumor suppressor homolog isoform X2 n=1 Tax=Aphidius gifuensis TaxID=684658 RepID=UPI001CDC0398|nr:fat-like cadherin-related tumor suppressor homolog isoform X2 [Aphidius gifuensis]